MKLGSLFDGSGGFPLAGVICGMEPVWASEIEKYPMKVTAARFPRMLQLGDVTKIKGSDIEPVDVITFGSPCQDLSVAGKQKGIYAGERSNLFFEAIRIIHEMREATNHQYPRYAVWENVPAFSSNHGGDFYAVLKAFCDEAEAGVHVPMPKNGKWKHAGCIVGDGWSIAWRLYDAQFWGVPQRRKRIYLVADFGSERAGKILFERESVRRYPPQSREAGEGTANDATGSAGRIRVYDCRGNGDGYTCPNLTGDHENRVTDYTGVLVYEKQKITYPMNYRNQVLDMVYTLEGNTVDRNSSKNGRGWSEGVTPTLNTQDRHAVCYPETERCMKARHDGSICADRGPNVVCYAPNGNHCGVYVNDDCAATLNTRYHYGSGGDDTLIAYAMQAFGEYKNSEVGSGLKARDYKDATDIVVKKTQRRYIVRRLTPLECCRLQGFPDWWEENVEGSDSARYKMWGNGIALPCAVDVLGRIADG